MTGGPRRLDARLAAASAALHDTSATPALDAELLLAHVLDRPRSYLRAWPERELTTAQATRFDALLAHRARGHPVAHLVGEREFWSLPIRVTPDVLIPRPDTEALVEVALEALPRGARVLDLGTGSGAIALALAHERPDLGVTATDVSEAALAVARANAAALGIHGVRFLRSDWFAGLVGGRFELVVANPPYIDPDEPELAEGDVRFEPRQALVAAEGGFADLARIIDGARHVLVADGRLLLEHGWRQGEGVRQRLSAAGYRGVSTYRDLAGHERVTGGWWGSRPPA